ncbi:hypothetical protein Q9X96_003090 [Vibrio vulnificus]|nr:hypothetical protein [Vibrio vulnificus]
MIVVNVTKEIPVNVNSLQVKIKKELPLNGNVELIKSKSNSVEFENTEHVVKVVTGAGIYDAQVNADKLEVTKLTTEVREAHKHIHADKSSVEQSEANALLYAQAADEAATDSERSSASSHQFAQESLASKNAAKTSETNAKASETKAKASETNAANSASTASTKASEASTSASKALASQNAAKTSETNAANSASTASTKATLATQQATIATTKASESSSSADAALESETNAAASQTAANASKNAAKTSETNAKASETKALASQNASASSAAAALESETNAAASEAAANASKNAAKTSETNAANSASTASTKADEALSSANAAKASQNAAKTSETNAKASETASASSKNAAAASASTASTKASEALSSANAAKVSETKSKTSETNAKASELKAAEYAATLAGGLNDGGNIDLSSGVYPAVPALPTFWKVTTGGTVSGIEYGVGDTLIYSKVSGFYKIDNTESVTSVNGFKGAVNLNASHVNAVSKIGDTMTGILKMSAGIEMRRNNIIAFHDDKDARKWTTGVHGSVGNSNFLIYNSGLNKVAVEITSTENNFVIQDRAYQQGSQGTSVNALTRKDYVDGQVNTRLAKTGGELTGDLVLRETNTADTYSKELKFQNTSFTAGIDLAKGGSLRFINRNDNTVPFEMSMADGTLLLSKSSNNPLSAVRKDYVDSNFIKNTGGTSSGDILARKFKATTSDGFAFITSADENQGMYLNSSDDRTIIGGGNTNGQIILRPKGISQTSSATTFNNDGSVQLGGQLRIGGNTASHQILSASTTDSFFGTSARKSVMYGNALDVIPNTVFKGNVVIDGESTLSGKITDKIQVRNHVINVAQFATSGTPQYAFIKTNVTYGAAKMFSLHIKGVGAYAKGYTCPFSLDLGWYYYNGVTYKPKAILHLGTEDSTFSNYPIYIVNDGGKFAFAIPSGYYNKFTVELVNGIGGGNFTEGELAGWTASEKTTAQMEAFEDKAKFTADFAFSSRLKPTWADVGGLGYIKEVDGRYQVGAGKWLKAGDSDYAGFLPSVEATGSAAKNYLGASTWWFKEAWVNQYRGGSVNVEGAGFFKGSVLSEYGGGGAVRLTGASGEGYLQGGLSDVAQVQRLNITGMSNSALTKCDIKMLGSNQPTVNGNAIYHAGNKPTADDVGLRLSTITKSLTLNNNWIDTGIEGSALASGSYMVQISGMSSSTGFYNEIFTGVMSWYDGSTNQQNSDEIILHAAGHARSDKTIYLRVLRQLSPNKLKLQISASHSLAASNYTFKFRRLI